MRILIVLMGSVGDVVRGLSIVSALKNSSPDVELTWLVEPRCEQLVRAVSAIDRVIVFQRQGGVRALWTIAQQLRTQTFDVTLDLQRHFKSGIFSWLSGAKRRIGFARLNSKECNWIFNSESIPAVDDSVSKIKVYASFLKKLGIEEEISGRVDFDDTRAEWRPEIAGKYIVLNLGSNWDSKNWPEEGYMRLIDLLIQSSASKILECKIVLCGTAPQSSIANRISAGRPVLNLAGKTDLYQLIGLIRGAQVVVGPDSGPGHISGALGIKHVTLFGPTPILRNVPLGSEQLALAAEIGCSPCGRKRCPGLGGLCMRLISPEMVLEQILAAIN